MYCCYNDAVDEDTDNETCIDVDDKAVIRLQALLASKIESYFSANWIMKPCVRYIYVVNTTILVITICNNQDYLAFY